MPTYRSKTKHQITGEQAERLAEKFLHDQGLVLIMRNFRCKTGEIDLVMQQGITLVFVEVRLRSDASFGSAADSVDFRKRKKLIRAAAMFLLLHREYGTMACRFDVIAIGDTSTTAIDWHSNAFDAY